jgi:hypothetical protein
VDLNVIQKISFIKMDEKVRKKMHVKEIMHGRMGESMGVGGGGGPVIFTQKRKEKKEKKRKNVH